MCLCFTVIKDVFMVYLCLFTFNSLFEWVRGTDVLLYLSPLGVGCNWLPLIIKEASGFHYKSPPPLWETRDEEEALVPQYWSKNTFFIEALAINIGTRLFCMGTPTNFGRHVA